MFRLGMYGHATRISLLVILFMCENVSGKANSGDVSKENESSRSTLFSPSVLGTECNPPAKRVTTQPKSKVVPSKKSRSRSMSSSPAKEESSHDTLSSSPKLTRLESENVRTKKSTSLKPAKTTALDYNRIPQPGLSFQHLREQKRIFVDKTKFLEYLLETGAIFYFVARPTRFGKTIFSQMTSSFFKGDEHNFVGLSIHDRGNGGERGEWVKYPVIYLDFGALDLEEVYTRKNFGSRLTDALLDVARGYNLTYMKEDFRLFRMVSDLKKSTGRPVVIIIDECDLPVRTALKRQNQNLDREILDYLTGFFAAIKSCVFNLKLVFVSGVSKLSINGLAYGGTYFVDLTNDEKFHAAMGLTGSEIHGRDFKPFIHKLASCAGMPIDEEQCGLDNKEECTARVKENTKKFWKSLNRWYNGYKFAVGVEGLLNPFSVLECLRRQKLGSYWRNDESVDALAKALTEKNLPWNFYENYRTGLNILFSTNDITGNVPLPVEMLMNGLLTIKSYYPKDEEIILHFPNDDIRETIREKVRESYIDAGKIEAQK